MGVGLTTAYRLKILALVIPHRGLSVAAPATGGGWGPAVKAPTLVLAFGAVWGGALLCVTASPSVLLGLDKAIPLLFIAAGLGLSVAVRALRLPYFSSMWNLTPAVQRSARAAVGCASPTGIDRGWAAAAGGAGLMAGGLVANVGVATLWLGGL